MTTNSCFLIHELSASNENMPRIVFGPGIDYVLWWHLAIVLIAVSRALLTEPGQTSAAAARGSRWRKLVFFYMCFAGVLGAAAWVRLQMPDPNTRCSTFLVKGC